MSQSFEDETRALEAGIRAELPGWTDLSLTMIGSDVSISGRYEGRPHAAWSGNRNPGDPIEYARYLHTLALAEHQKGLDKAASRASLVEKLRRLLKEKAHAEIPRPVHDGSAPAGDGAGSEPAAAADHPDPAGSGLGLAGAQDQPTDQDSATNANAPVDAEFSEPDTPPEPPVDDSAGQAGLPEFDVGEADEPDFGGMVRDDRVAELSKQIDAIAKDRMAVAEAFETNSREAMEEIESKHAGGLELTEEEEQIRREFARARIAIRTLTDIATDHKKALATMSDEDLMALNPERLKWT